MTRHIIHTGGAEIVSIADINRNGWDDIIFTDWDGGKVYIALNQQDGTFAVSLIADSLPMARDVVACNVLNKTYDEIPTRRRGEPIAGGNDR